MLCRNYVKGRDWFDFSWFVAKKIRPNYPLLSQSLKQMGPWKGMEVEVNGEWYVTQMKQKILSIDWKVAKKDVERFLKPEDLLVLELWSEEFFLQKLQKLLE